MTHSSVSAVSEPISLGMVPSSWLLGNDLSSVYFNTLDNKTWLRCTHISTTRPVTSHLTILEPVGQSEPDELGTLLGHVLD